jgi:hypothetical protein
MSLVDQYVTEVGKTLPRKTHSDIEAEIRSLIDDMLEDRSKQVGRAPDEDMMVEVLKELGSPEKMAASYQGEKYLIGPRFYPTFILVLKIVATVLVVIAAIRFGVGVAQPGLTVNGFFTLFTTSLGELVNSLLVALGNIVLIFAVIQWAVPGMKVKSKEWDPRSLKSILLPDALKPVGIIWDIAVTIFVILVFNFHPEWVGMGYLQNGIWYWVPILSQAFFSYIPWLNLIWAGTVVLNIILLRQMRWQPLTRWIRIGLRFFNIVILYHMLVGPSIINFSTVTLTQYSQAMSQAPGLTNLQPLLDGSAHLLVALVLVLEGVELGKSLYQMLFKKGEPAITQSGS